MMSILVATDLSERSDRAVMRALRLAERDGADCEALFVADDSMPGDLVASLSAEAEGRLRRFLDAAPGGKRAKAAVIVGDPVQVICDHAATIGADLVVLGLHRPRPYIDALRETMMERLVRLLPQPVLLVREPADHEYRSVLAPVSYSPACAAAIRAARLVAPEAKIVAFHAAHVPFTGLTGEGQGGAFETQILREAEAARVDWAETEGLTGDLAKVANISGSLGQVFDAQLSASHADLVVIGAHTRTVYLGRGLGSFAADCIRNPPTDLLIARPSG